MKLYYLLIVLFGFSITPVFGQDNSRGESSELKEDLNLYQAPVSKKEKTKAIKLSRRQFKKTYLYWFYNHHEKLRDDFYKRKRKLKKGYRRMARIMNKPQYRDHAYFGHKRKPKIRPVGKRKFCDECGIVH